MPRKTKTTATKKDTKEKRSQVINAQKAQQNLKPLPLDPPLYMQDTVAGKAWRRLVPMLNDLGTAKLDDYMTVEALCSAYMLYSEAFDSIKEKGQSWGIYKTPISPTGKMGTPELVKTEKNPAVATITTAMARIRSFSADLGLSPASRNDLLSENSADGDKKSVPGLDELLSGTNTFDNYKEYKPNKKDGDK